MGEAPGHQPPVSDTGDDKTPLIIDVRTPQEFAGGHLKDAVNIPYDKIASEIVQHAPDKRHAILLYCRSGTRASIALKVLTNMGYEKVVNAGGYEEARRRIHP